MEVSSTNIELVAAPKEEASLTCGSCRHWHKLPTDPQNVKAVKGECRKGWPQIYLTEIGGGQMARVAGYPCLHPGFPACSYYTSKEEEADAS